MCIRDRLSIDFLSRVETASAGGFGTLICEARKVSTSGPRWLSCRNMDITAPIIGSGIFTYLRRSLPQARVAWRKQRLELLPTCGSAVCGLFV